MEEDFIENTSELEMTLKDFREIPPKKDNYQNNNDIKSFVASFNNSIVKDALMPELKENEHQKRKLKKTVLKGVCFFIFFYSLFMFICLILLIYTITIGSNKFLFIDSNLCSQLINFMKFFVTASLCEFIAMLFMIVKYVFDKSIVELVRLFKDDSSKSIDNDISKSNNNNNLHYENIAQYKSEESA